MSEMWATVDSTGYEPDFVERNGAWILSVMALVGSCCTAVLVYFLKSRCVSIRCCGMECIRDVLNLDATPDRNLRLNNESLPRQVRLAPISSESSNV